MPDSKPDSPDKAVKPTKASEPHEPKGKANDQKPDTDDVDRPGFDLGGSTGKTHAGTGVGLGEDAAESTSSRSLPGRRGKRQ